MARLPIRLIGSILAGPMCPTSKSSRTRYFLLAPLLAVALLTLTAGAAFGREPASPDADSAAPITLTGFDVSYPQCGDTYPRDVAFGIVGVTGGVVFSENPCLGAGGTSASQLAWAGLNAELYMNTANPGPDLSSHWPIGQISPRECGTSVSAELDTADCAYDYGWNSAADAYAAAIRAYVSLGWADEDATRTPVANRWWLDVETANSWRTDVSLNVAALHGAADYLASVEAESVGFYSVGTMWDEITGGTSAFADHPSWVAGASTLRGARAGCDGPAFTGGSLHMTQYLSKGFDANYRC
jgi:hypothetical protein